MLCPYCQKEMEQGKMVGGSWYLQYVPDEDKIPLSYNKSEHGIAFNKDKKFWLSVYYVKAFRCKGCKKIIIDVAEYSE